MAERLLPIYTERQDMNIISIIGNVDKRIIALPLARAFSLSGKTCIITDNTEYIRLLERAWKGGNIIGNCHGIAIYYKQKLDGTEIELVNKVSGEETQNVIYVSNEYIADSAKLIYLVKGLDNSFLGDEIAKQLEEMKANRTEYKDRFKEILLAINGMAKKSSNPLQSLMKPKKTISDGRIILTYNEFAWLWKCEEHKEILPFLSKELTPILSDIGSKVLSIKESQMTELLTRDSYIKGKKK